MTKRMYEAFKAAVEDHPDKFTIGEYCLYDNHSSTAYWIAKGWKEFSVQIINAPFTNYNPSTLCKIHFSPFYRFKAYRLAMKLRQDIAIEMITKNLPTKPSTHIDARTEEIDLQASNNPEEHPSDV